MADGLISRIYDMFQPSREEQFQGLLGERSQPQSGPMQPGQQPQQMGGSGFLGSEQGMADKMRLQAGMLGAGYSQPEVAGMLGNLPQAQKPTAFQQNFQAFQNAAPEVQQQMQNFRRSGAMNVNLNNGGTVGTPYTPAQKSEAGFNPDAVVIPDKNGIPRVISQGKFTQPQILSGTYANRMETANQTFEQIMATGFNPSDISQSLDRFGVPDILASGMRSPEGQMYRQGQENWVSANLRKESGAAIPEPEMEREIKKWFPQPFDSDEVIAKKAESRRDAAFGMQKAAGGAYEDLREQSDRARLDEGRAKRGIK